MPSTCWNSTARTGGPGRSSVGRRAFQCPDEDLASRPSPLWVSRPGKGLPQPLQCNLAGDEKAGKQSEAKVPYGEVQAPELRDTKRLSLQSSKTRSPVNVLFKSTWWPTEVPLKVNKPV
jgi:hypothetical protein